MLAKEPTKFDKDANGRAQSLWQCPECKIETIMKFSDLADIGIPVCSGCAGDMTLSNVSVSPDSIFVYLHLFHGREDPDQQMEDWGQDGPTFRFTYVHTTYGDDLKIETLNEQEDYFTVHGGMVYYDGMFYGDWSVYSKDNPAAPKKYETFDPQKARVPEKYRTIYPDLEFNRELVLSPDHITEECNNAIIGAEPGDDPAGPLGMLSVYGGLYGFRLFTTFDTDDELPETAFPELDRLLSFAKEMRCKWLAFDCEVPPCTKFETFDRER